jgi:hypothetical protein
LVTRLLTICGLAHRGEAPRFGIGDVRGNHR